MAQIFHRRANTIARASLLALALGIVFIGWAGDTVYWSPYTTRVNTPINQPVPFSHHHHYEQLGIDCRYCHTSVEKSSFAGVPDTETCMTCHSQLFTTAPLLAPIRHSLASDEPMRWNRVTKLPDFVFFNHSIHIAKGVGCATCHGQIDKMPLTWKTETFYMKWCLDCHKQPENFLRPHDKVFEMDWRPPPNQVQAGLQLAAANHVNTTELKDCSRCHR
jgi:hypothetical protein